MTECKNMMAILGELTDNAKEVDNEQIEAVEKTDHRGKKNFCKRCGTLRICCQRIFQPPDASWVYRILCR